MMTRLPPLEFSLICRPGETRLSALESVMFCFVRVSALTAEMASGVCWMLVARLSAVTTISVSFPAAGAGERRDAGQNSQHQGTMRSTIDHV
ncbi:MAG: hypothetical protein J0I73_10950 [Sphingomonas sp.]|uniref:hypothetical protein n=1 Tax=Sphingomonas sp. TaxID=28214 RepID=UPI001AC4D601|nr:hypothetical protein [Sphingomonas sp.]MBN8848599.1 hypothetical protein [Sphingomonas sp.]